MISTFPSPILSVAADAVKDIDGEDALCGLWALFTKCKESLKDGRRLENISWRLWYRELASAQSSPTSSPGSLSPSFSEKRSPSPITPVSEDGQQLQLPHPEPIPSPDLQTPHSWHAHNHSSPSPLITVGRRLSTASAPMERRKSANSLAVGRFILDILPHKLDVKAEQATRASVVPQIVQPRPVVAALPTVQLHTSPPQINGHSFPRVVVVNPTPHPTPPATPALPHAPAIPAQPSTHLLPPPLARSLVPATVTHARTGPSKTPSPNKLASPPQLKQPAACPSLASKLPSHDAIPHGASKQKPYNDDTLKASDRRFFLQDAGSPSPERPPSNDSDLHSEMPEQEQEHEQHEEEHSPSSATSSQMKTEVTALTNATAGAPRRPRVQVRKSKERHAPVRPALQRLHSHGIRQTSQKKVAVADTNKKTTFNIGSVSSNGSRSGCKSNKPPEKDKNDKSRRPSSPSGKAPTIAKPANVSAAAPPAGKARANGAGPSQQRREFVISTSSEYETDTDDDSEWASEDSAEEPTKERQAKAAEEARLREAAEEAQRQRDMFAKAPKRSYSNLNRTRSGLLSQLLNPDPNLFPPNHPYRSTQSTQDMTQFARQVSAPMLQMSKSKSKSSAAVPLAAQVTAQAPVVPPDSGRPGGGYRPKGRPQDEELEDTESDDDNGDTIQVSHSLAQQKLAALADPNRRRHSERGLLSQQAEKQREMRDAGAGRTQLLSVATAPIPLNHPYNLPPPELPTTPRTTRRQMLQTELSESLRRNLLWERQVSRKIVPGRRGGVLGAGLRPLTAANGAGEPPVGVQTQQPPFPPQTQTQAQAQARVERNATDGDDKQERKRRALDRNRSWADDYHYSGW